MAARFGGHLKSDFSYDPSWTNLNHGSFGGIPLPVKAKLREYQDDMLSRPDVFLRYSYTTHSLSSRTAVSRLLRSPVSSVVFVANATEAVNTVFRNLSWNQDGKDVIFHFSTTYPSCKAAISYVVDYFGPQLSAIEIPLSYPLEDDDIIQAFRDAVRKATSEGKRPRIAVFDVVSSLPAVAFPWERMVATCRQLNVLSFVDGAQGIGMVHLDIPRADPDFFTSNCHKWLFTPLGCAVFYAAPRNQALLRTPLATTVYHPVHKGGQDFASTFDFTGTRDYSPWYCVADAIAYRRDVLGGEDRILGYLQSLNKQGSKHVAHALRTNVLENRAGSLTNCAMANVALPIWVGERGQAGNETDVVVSPQDKDQALQWMMTALYRDYKTFAPLFCMHGRFWVRLSAQVYLDIKDYEFAADTIKRLCERVANKEYLHAAQSV